MATPLENQLENVRLRVQESAAGHFLRWWLAELRQLLPPELRARLQHARRRLILRVSNDELELSEFDGDARAVLDVFALDQNVGVQQQQIRDLLMERELHDVSRDLLLDETRVLVKEVVLPLAAESNLRQALRFEMDRQTPFQADRVYFDFRILNRDRENSQLRVELAVCPRETIDGLLDVLATRGMAPTGVDVELRGAPAGLNLLPPEKRYRIVNRRARLNSLLGLAALVLLAVVMAQSLWLRQNQIEHTREAIEEVGTEARRVRNIRNQIEDASEAAGFMLKRRAESPPTVTVLAEVTRILPDDTFLDRLRIWEGNVQMQGKSDNAQQLIETVNQSGLFEGASFRGPTRLDNRSDREIFDLTATLSQVERS